MRTVIVLCLIVIICCILRTRPEGYAESAADELIYLEKDIESVSFYKEVDSTTSVLLTPKIELEGLDSSDSKLQDYTVKYSDITLESKDGLCYTGPAPVWKTIIPKWANAWRTQAGGFNDVNDNVLFFNMAIPGISRAPTIVAGGGVEFTVGAQTIRISSSDDPEVLVLIEDLTPTTTSGP